MGKIIQFETSGPLCSVAIGIDGETVAHVQDSEPNSHARKITLIMDEALNKAGCRLSDIDAVAVSAGPGSYTGLRVGTSAAKGICFARNLPLIAVPTLKLLADAAIQESGNTDALYVSMIDARRMEVYTAGYDGQLNTVLSPQAKIIDESGYSDIVTKWGKTVVYCGSGLSKCMDHLKGTDTVFYPEITHSASYLTRLAFNQYNSGAFEDVAYFKPFYLKLPNITIPKPML